MADTPNISSTDKLLELIRRTPGNKDGDNPAPQPLALAKGWRKVLELGKPQRAAARDVALGVEVGPSLIRMVKLGRAGGRPRSLEFKTVPVPPSGPDAPELSLVLRLAIKDFLGRAEADVWSVVAPESAEIRFLQVPKVAKKQLSNAIFWTAKKEGSFDVNEVVFDYEIQGEVIEKGAARLNVLAYTVARTEYERLRNLFLQAGYALTGLTLPSVSSRALLRGGWLTDAGLPQACIHLGGDFSRLEIFSGTALQYVRVLKGGLASMAAVLSEASREWAAQGKWSAQESSPPEPEVVEIPTASMFGSDIPIEIESMSAVSAEPAQSAASRASLGSGGGSGGASPGGSGAEAQGAPGLSVEQARALLESLATGPENLPPDNPGRGLAPEDVLEMIKPAWERLLRQVEMTFKHYSITMGNEQVALLDLAGSHAAQPLFLAFLGEQLGMPCRSFDPLTPDNLGRMGVRAPALGPAERLPYVMALGLTGADPAECNLLHTYKQKEDEARIEGLNRVVMAGWLALACLCLGVFFWQQAQAHFKQQELAGLQARLHEFTPLVDVPLLVGTNARVRATVDNMRAFANRALPAAILRDIIELTPENVKIFAIAMNLGNPSEQPLPPSDKPLPPGQTPPKQKVREGQNTLTIEGYAKGDSQILESVLAAYMVRLRTSPLLGDPSVVSRTQETTPAGEDALRFMVSCTVTR